MLLAYWNEKKKKMLLNVSFCQQSTIYGLTDQFLYLDLE